LLVCHDLEGNRKWLTMDCDFPPWEHGQNGMPFLAGDEFIVSTTDMKAYDRETGKLKWKIQRPKGYQQFTMEREALVPEGSDDVVWFELAMYRPGAGLFPANSNGGTTGLNVKSGNTIVKYTGAPNPWDKALFYVYDFPPVIDRTTKPAMRKVELQFPKGGFPYPSGPGVPGVIGASGISSASPLIHDGLLYQLSCEGVMRVFDEKTLVPVWSERLPIDPYYYGQYPNGVPAGASPTLAGDYIYILGSGGTCLVIKPGRKYELVAKNSIEQACGRGAAHWIPGPAAFLSSPVFDGKHMYIRGEDWLYCVGEDDKK